MRYLSLFSGIEAASVAWEPLGWEPVAFCEIDAFPSAVLAYRYPDVPNLCDITKVDWYDFKERYGAVDLIVGGSPCQSFSYAAGANRTSLDGKSNLMLEWVRAVEAVRPRWVVWENVPGALNTRDDAFGCLLRALYAIGYRDLAWRVLDAQFFGVAQRRRRVFLVGYLAGGGFRSAAVLFDSESVRGSFETNAEKRQALAEAAGRGAGCAGFKYHQGARAHGIGYEPDQSPTLTADWHQHAVVCIQGVNMPDGNRNGSGLSDDLSFTLNATDVHGVLCMASDTSKAAINEDVSGTLLVGGGAPWIVQGR